MTRLNLHHFTRFSSLVVLAVSLAVAPALAGNGNGNGNGGGNGGGNGKSESHGGGSSKSEHASTGSEKSSTKATAAKQASSYGKLNGFLHASKQAMLKASPKSAIGKVATVYAGLLKSYLSPEAGVTPPTVDEIAAALRAAANKPVTSAVVAAVNQRLLETNPDLSASLTASGKTPEQLADEIAAAM